MGSITKSSSDRLSPGLTPAQGAAQLLRVTASGANGQIAVAVRAARAQHLSPRQSGLVKAMDDETGKLGHARRTTFVNERAWATFGAFKAGITGRKGEAAVARALALLGYAALHDVLLPDQFGVTQIDHVVRASEAIVVIETKTYGGHITGTLHGSDWVQHLAAGDIRNVFQNPARQNHRHRRAVEAALAGFNVAIVGCIVSAGSATFCAGLKGTVVPICQIGDLFRQNPARTCNPMILEEVWNQLAAAVAAAEPRREEHHETIGRYRDGLGRSGRAPFATDRFGQGDGRGDNAAV
jgi:hypothetical protein